MSLAELGNTLNCDSKSALSILKILLWTAPLKTVMLLHNDCVVAVSCTQVPKVKSGGFGKDASVFEKGYKHY